MKAFSTSGQVRPQSKRIVGLDIARAFAITGMVLVNFKIVMGADESGPDWLHAIASAFDGRAAATFVVLAGIGATLGTRKARESGDTAQRRRAQFTLVKRAIFLFAAGWAFFPIWPADILHFYGIYMVIGALILFAPRRSYWAAIAAAMLISFSFLMTFDPFHNWNLDDLSYRGLNTPSGFIRNLFFDGFHPVFPWVSFYLLGMWLGRTDLRDALWRRKLAIVAGALVLVTEALSWWAMGPKGASTDHLADDSWRWLFYVGPIPPLPLYLIAGGGTAVLVIIGSIWLGEHLAPKVAEPLISTGQMALTVYFAHVLIGMGVLEAIGRLENQSLTAAVTASLIFCGSAVVICWLWRRKFKRGPIEWVMRKLT